MIARILHPLMLTVVKTLRISYKEKIIYLNKKPHVCKNAIYACNHSCYRDIPIACEIVKDHFYLLLGVQKLDIMSKLLFIMNGVVWVDRDERKSRQQAAKQLVELLKAGKNVLYYPEGTWNLQPSKPALPLYWGGVRIAQEAGYPIIPVCFEYSGASIYVKFGQPINVGKEDDRLNKFDELTDAFSTLKWEIWEQFPIEKRATFDMDWDKEVKRRLDAYPLLDYEKEKRVIRKSFF